MTYGHGPAIAATLADWLPEAWAEARADAVSTYEVVDVRDRPLLLPASAPRPAAAR